VRRRGAFSSYAGSQEAIDVGEPTRFLTSAVGLRAHNRLKAAARDKAIAGYSIAIERGPKDTSALLQTDKVLFNASLIDEQHLAAGRPRPSFPACL
jgi:hypothetical protein